MAEFDFLTGEFDLIENSEEMEISQVDVKTEPVEEEIFHYESLTHDHVEVKTEPTFTGYYDGAYHGGEVINFPPVTYMNPADIKIEPNEEDHIVVPQEEREQYVYKCRVCRKTFESRYAFTVHVNKHEKKCTNCKCVYESWKELEDHEPFCARRFGRTIINTRYSRRPKTPKPTPYKCSLCKRKYETYNHLFKHQVHRCQKRYITKKWVVKI